MARYSPIASTPVVMSRTREPQRQAGHGIRGGIDGRLDVEDLGGRRVDQDALPVDPDPGAVGQEAPLEEARGAVDRGLVDGPIEVEHQLRQVVVEAEELLDLRAVVDADDHRREGDGDHRHGQTHLVLLARVVCLRSR